MSARDDLATAAERILIKDGAFGTEIQNRGWRGRLSRQLDLSPRTRRAITTSWPDPPGVVEAITRAYSRRRRRHRLAPTPSTPTASARPIMAPSIWSRDINRAAARIAREVADEFEARGRPPRFVAGALGPTNKTLSLSPDVNDPGFREIDFDG
jgi:5-methyltetrahydrofolate--homocysteine methyltransferase